MRMFFVSDLHGDRERYDSLFNLVMDRSPEVVLMGGDLLRAGPDTTDLIDWMLGSISRIRDRQTAPTEFLMIPGNDDPRAYEGKFTDAERSGIVRYISEKAAEVCGWRFYGYPYIPPSPFILKDWELYDVSRYVDPGCVPPEEGSFSTDIDRTRLRHRTIWSDLEPLIGMKGADRTIYLFHAPPYDTALDLAGIGGAMVDHAPLDPHIGSIGVRRFIEAAGPSLTLHGHVHESARLTGRWSDRIGSTTCLSAAHDGPELALVTFDPERPDRADRELIRP